MEWWEDPYLRDEVLMRRTRIRRPVAMSDGLKPDDRRPLNRVLANPPPGYQVPYRRQGWRHVGWSATGVRRRLTLAHIVQDGRAVGAIKFAEYRLAAMLFDEEFYDALDSDSAEEEKLACAIVSAWDWACLEIGGYGDIIECREVWMEPGHVQPVAWSTVIHAMLRELFSSGAAFFVHAFPLEYDGRSPVHAPSYVGFQRRQKAMIRMAERRFGLRSLPGPFGEEGWMWAPAPRVAGYIDAPKYNEDWVSEL